MALHYGFIRNFETKNEKLEAETSKMFKALTDEQKQIFHNVIPHLLVGVGVSSITPSSIRAIASRACWAYEGWVAELLGQSKPAFRWEDNVAPFTNYLTPYMWMRTNVGNETNREFVARMSQRVLRFKQRDMLKELDAKLKEFA